MNCLDIRRALLADPRTSSLELSVHLAECESCRQFAARLAHDQAVLRAALAVPVPEQLEERILLHTQLRSRRPGWLGRLGYLLQTLAQPHLAAYAVAASMALALGLWWPLPSPERPVAWSEVVLAHVIGEANTLAKADALPQQSLSVALKDYGLALKGELGTLRYFDHCALPGGRGVHAVIETPDLGKVTLILPPIGTRADPGLAQREGYAAQMLRIDQASIGVVTQRPDQLEALTQRIRRQLVSSI